MLITLCRVVTNQLAMLHCCAGSGEDSTGTAQALQVAEALKEAQQLLEPPPAPPAPPSSTQQQHQGAERPLTGLASSQREPAGLDAGAAGAAADGAGAAATAAGSQQPLPANEEVVYEPLWELSDSEGEQAPRSSSGGRHLQQPSLQGQAGTSSQQQAKQVQRRKQDTQRQQDQQAAQQQVRLALRKAGSGTSVSTTAELAALAGAAAAAGAAVSGPSPASGKKGQGAAAGLEQQQRVARDKRASSRATGCSSGTATHQQAQPTHVPAPAAAPGAPTHRALTVATLRKRGRPNKSDAAFEAGATAGAAACGQQQVQPKKRRLEPTLIRQATSPQRKPAASGHTAADAGPSGTGSSPSRHAGQPSSSSSKAKQAGKKGKGSSSKQAKALAKASKYNNSYLRACVQVGKLVA
jgi:hypothetical protein